MLDAAVRTSGRRRAALAASLGCHALALAVFVAWRATPARPEGGADVMPATLAALVWHSTPGPAGGGGGGGETNPAPARPIAAPGRDALSVPARTVAIAAPEAIAPEPPPVPVLEIPARSLASADALLMGALQNAAPASSSRGLGAEDGADGGRGRGAGPGEGIGAGPGEQASSGDGPYQPGSGVTAPILIHSVRPAFTTEAMHARVSGVALLDCVVNPDGTVSNIRVVRSVDPRYGLDAQAIAALRQWRFKPGMKQGTPVPVAVRVELFFALH
jgi:protein TonB